MGGAGAFLAVPVSAITMEKRIPAASTRQARAASQLASATFALANWDAAHASGVPAAWIRFSIVHLVWLIDWLLTSLKLCCYAVVHLAVAQLRKYIKGKHAGSSMILVVYRTPLPQLPMRFGVLKRANWRLRKRKPVV